jgi:acyl-CoA thioester hydrolase
MKKPIKIQVRFSDLDILGHVNNSVYLSYFEIARVAFFSPLMGLDWDWQKKGVLIKKNEIEYFSPVLLHQEPEISIYTRSIGTKSFILEYDLYVNEKLYTSGSSVLVCYDSINQTTINVPKEMRQVLEGLKRNDS